MPRPSRPPSPPPPDRSPAEALVERLDARTSGAVAGLADVPSGFPSVDRLLGGGFRRQDLVILSGDVGCGKSCLALAIALRSARAGAPVVYLSGEMSEDRLTERALALEARVGVDAIRRSEMDDLTRSAIGAAALRLRDLPLHFRALPGEQFDEVTDALATVPRRSLLILDDLQMTASPAGTASLEERTAATARALKTVALEHDVAVLAVAQLPGLKPDRPDPRPTLEDLGGLGTIKQMADVVLAIYREEMYRPSFGVEGAVELIVAKNRNGPTGYADLYFYRNWLRFEDVLDREK